MFHSKTKEVQKTSEELRQKTSEIRELYNEFAEELLGKLTFLDKTHFRASSYLDEKIYANLVLQNGQLTINQLVNIFKWYIGRLNVRTICGFNNQEFLRESRDLKKSGIHLDISFQFKKNIEVIHGFGIKFNVSKGYIEEAMFKKFKEIEINAVNLLGYERGQWILQEIFVEGDDKDHFLLREQALEKFLKAEYQEFIARWEGLILEKQEEVRAVYSQSLKDIATKLKQGKYDWLSVN